MIGLESRFVFLSLGKFALLVFVLDWKIIVDFLNNNNNKECKMWTEKIPPFPKKSAGLFAFTKQN